MNGLIGLILVALLVIILGGIALSEHKAVHRRFMKMLEKHESDLDDG